MAQNNVSISFEECNSLFSGPAPTCENCAHWLGDYFNPTYAKNGKNKVSVGQCGNMEDDRAPYAALDVGEAYVFTRADSGCAGFELNPDLAADSLDIDATYRELDAELLRDAWV